MDKLPEKTKDLITVNREIFAKWLKNAKELLYPAVFENQLDVMAVLEQDLKDYQVAIAAMLKPLAQHLSGISISQPEDVSVESRSSGGRMAASLPWMNNKSPVAVGPISSAAAAVVGKPMAVSMTSAITSNNAKDDHVFMEPYKKNLPTCWREPTRLPVSESNTVSPQHFDSNGKDSVEDENESCYSDQSGIEVPKKVFLLNLARDSNSKSIAKYFEKYGSVVDVKIFRFPNGDSRGQGWIEFIAPEYAEQVIKENIHRIDGRPVEAKPFIQRESRNGAVRSQARSFQIFLGGLPSHLSEEEVKLALSRYDVKVRGLRLISERGYAYVDLERDEDAEKLLKLRYVKIGQKTAECKENRRP